MDAVRQKRCEVDGAPERRESRQFPTLRVVRSPQVGAWCRAAFARPSERLRCSGNSWPLGRPLHIYCGSEALVAQSEGGGVAST